MSDSQLVLSALYRYPVKSMRGERLDTSPVSPIGLPFDRHWMVADPNGHLMTGREYPELVLIESAPTEHGVRLSVSGRETLFVPNTAFTKPHPATVWSDTFSAWSGADEADDWISAYVGARLKFLWIGAETSRRLRDDAAVPLSFSDGFPLLLATQASLDDLSARVGRPLAMERFRPNLVVTGSDAFAEDGWKRFRIGDAVFRVSKPCERCVFTTVDPQTGCKSLDQEPLRTLAKYRRTPAGVIFGQNVIVEGSSELRVGMPIEILE